MLTFVRGVNRQEDQQSQGGVQQFFFIFTIVGGGGNLVKHHDDASVERDDEQPVVERRLGVVVGSDALSRGVLVHGELIDVCLYPPRSVDSVSLTSERRMDVLYRST